MSTVDPNQPRSQMTAGNTQQTLAPRNMQELIVSLSKALQGLQPPSSNTPALLQPRADT